MPLLLKFHTETGIEEFPLSDGRVSVGSDRDSGVVLTHVEAPPKAVTIEVTGDSAVVYNRGDYAIYVGEEELAPGQPSAWPHDATVYLTASTSLTLEPVGVRDDAAPLAGAAASSSRKATQLAVIAICGVIGLQQMLAGPVESESTPKASFQELRLELQQQVDRDLTNGNRTASRHRREALRLLQEAWYYEKRIGSRRPNEMVRAYQRLLDCEALRRIDALPDDSSEDAADPLADRLMRFATAKKAQFGK